MGDGGGGVKPQRLRAEQLPASKAIVGRKAGGQELSWRSGAQQQESYSELGLDSHLAAVVTSKIRKVKKDKLTESG